MNTEQLQLDLNQVDLNTELTLVSSTQANEGIIIGSLDNVTMSDDYNISLNIPEEFIKVKAGSQSLLEGETTNTLEIDENFVKEYFKVERLVKSLSAQISEVKAKIKESIEANNVGSFQSNGMKVVYTSATTTTTIDSAKLKKEQPEIAAKYSKVGAKSSSVTISELK